MPARRIIALDAMGGDHGPEVVIPGAAIALVRHPDLGFILVGDEKPIGAELATRPELAERSRIVHTDLVVSMRDKPSQALRRGKGSSMWLALAAVQKGEAHAAVSAGNTGALMAMAKLVLRPMRGIERPAIAALWPTVSAECIVLDVGANIGASARQLSDFALMGAAMARAVPRRAAHRRSAERRRGRYQGRRGGPPGAHVAEGNRGAAAGVSGLRGGPPDRAGGRRRRRRRGLRGQHRAEDGRGHGPPGRPVPQGRSVAVARFATRRLLARGGLKVLKEKMDPRRVNGGTFLGLNGIAVKSHGTDALGFASAVDLGYDMAESGLWSGSRPTSTASITSSARPFEAQGRRRSSRRAAGGGMRPASMDQGKRVAVIRSVIRGVGGYLPSRVLTNHDLAKLVDTTDEWIVERSGIARGTSLRTASSPPISASPPPTRRSCARASTPSTSTSSYVPRPRPTAPFRPPPCASSRAWRHQGCRVRHPGGVLRLRLRPDRCRQLPEDRPVQAGARGRGRSVLAHPRLVRPRHVRFGDGAGAVVLEAQPQHSGGNDRGDPRHAHPLRRALREHALRRRRSRLDQDRGSPAHERARGVPSRHPEDHGRDRRDARDDGYAADEIDLYIPHQANQRISTASPPSSASRPTRSSRPWRATAIPRRPRSRSRSTPRSRSTA